MRVEIEPQGASPREILDQLLAPHGLRAEVGAGGRLVVVAVAPPRRRAPASLPAPVRRGPSSQDPASRFEDAILVTPDGEAVETGAHGRFSLDLAEAAAVPHLGDDPLRAVGALAGGQVRETSSRLHLRGGRDDEVLILLDGLELLAPYHLQDFDSALSIVAPATVESAELIASGYPAAFGDRLGGVLDLRTAAPGSRRFGLGLGLLNAELAASGGLAGGRGAWYAAARGGSYRLALEIEGREEDPRFWDLFGKVETELGAGHSLRLTALAAEDRFGFRPKVPGEAAYDNRWGNGYLWLSHAGRLRPDLQLEVIASSGEIERRRAGSAAEPAARYEVADRRTLGLAGLKQVWRFEPGGRFSRRPGSTFATSIPRSTTSTSGASPGRSRPCARSRPKARPRSPTTSTSTRAAPS
jgi:hypothetical protein